MPRSSACLQMKKIPLVVLSVILAATTAGAAYAFDSATVNSATYDENSSADGWGIKGPDAVALKLQIMLDRAHFSPGLIDGQIGDNTEHALREFEKRSGLPADGRLDREAWNALSQGMPEVLVSYEVTKEDVAGPFAESIPEDFAAMADMDSLPYTSTAELLAEKFHIDIELLRMLNPDAPLERPGEQITVPNVADVALEGEVERIEIDKSKGVLRGYGPDGAVLVVYPASIGSDVNPSPTGKMSVKGVARNPKYSYRPDKNFKQQGNDDPLTLPPGPNGPVGSIWIDLTKETYGIHGTADPEIIGKTSSHGCVRLTNWDAQQLGRLVKPGTKVFFVE
jgi:lipoprotein-anchoring transpeptidase ErfK/SrfK